MEDRKSGDVGLSRYFGITLHDTIHHIPQSNVYLYYIVFKHFKFIMSESNENDFDISQVC